MKLRFTLITLLLALACLSGCAGYQRGATVPNHLRKVHIPAFENMTDYPMAGAMVSQQLADALIEDGTFTLTSYEDADIRLSGVVASPSARAIAYERNYTSTPDEYIVRLQLKLYVVEAESGEFLLNGKIISGRSSMITHGDFQTSLMNALPRVAKNLAKSTVIELHTLGANETRKLRTDE